MDNIEFKPLKTIPNRYYIIHESEAKGIIEFKNENEYVEIDYIKVYEEYRRMGIGTQVINFIKNKYPNKVIYGDSLPEAIDFWTSIGVEFGEKMEGEITTPFRLI